MSPRLYRSPNGSCPFMSIAPRRAKRRSSASFDRARSSLSLGNGGTLPSTLRRVWVARRVQDKDGNNLPRFLVVINHAAVNRFHRSVSQESIAITQNYVSAANLRQVLNFLSSRNPDLISGLEGVQARQQLHDDFLLALQAQRPEALTECSAIGRALDEKLRVRTDLLSNGATGFYTQ